MFFRLFLSVFICVTVILKSETHHISDDETCAIDDVTCSQNKVQEESKLEKTPEKAAEKPSLNVGSLLKETLDGDALGSVVSVLIDRAGPGRWEKLISELEQLLLDNKTINPIVKTVLQGILRVAKSSDSDKIVKYLKSVYSLVPEGAVDAMLGKFLVPVLDSFRQATERFLKNDEKVNKLDPMIRMVMKSVVEATKSNNLAEITPKLKQIYNLIPKDLVKSTLKSKGVPDNYVELVDKLPKWE